MTDKLKSIITELMDAADMAAASRTGKFAHGVQIRDGSAFVRLKHGLGIRLKNDGGAYILSVWRIDQLPAMQEWNIVTACFPYNVPVITPTGHTHERVHYYRGRIPARPEVTGIRQV
jgi:hypothetical protein